MVENLIHNNGLTIAASGLLVVFVGLILISLIILAFNNIAGRLRSRRQIKEGSVSPPSLLSAAKSADEKIPNDHLIAIATAVEFYRRLHFDVLQSEITFAKGSPQSAWRIGGGLSRRFLPARLR